MPDLARVPDLDQLRALVAVAGRGSMSAASRDLGISQQAVSARVTGAERVLGVAVFERSTRGVSVTEAGRLVVTWASEILDAATVLDRGVESLRAGSAHEVRVAASNTVSEALLPGWAARLRAEHDAVRLHVVPGNSDTVLDLVARGSVDLGFVEGPRVPRTLRSRVVAQDTLVVVVPPDHRWATRRAPVSREEVAATPLVLREEGSGTRERLEQALGEHVPPAQVLGSTAAVRDASVTLGAPTVLSSLAVQRDLEAGRLVRVPVLDLPLPRRLRAVWHPARRPRGAAADLLRLAAATVTTPAAR